MAIKIFEAATAERWENSKTEMREKKNDAMITRQRRNRQSTIGNRLHCLKVFLLLLLFDFWICFIFLFLFYFDFSFALLQIRFDRIDSNWNVDHSASGTPCCTISTPYPTPPCDDCLVFLLIIASSSLQQCQSVSAYFIRDTSLELLLLTML